MAAETGRRAHRRVGDRAALNKATAESEDARAHILRQGECERLRR